MQVGLNSTSKNVYLHYTFLEAAMQASILDLRYKMKDVLRALERNETVEILYHGKVKGVIMPCQRKLKQKVKDHPFFGMDDSSDVETQMKQLRQGRYDDL